MKPLFEVAHAAGIKLFGYPLVRWTGGEGLIWNNETDIVRCKLSDVPKPPYSFEDDYQDGPAGSYPFVDDFEFQFYLNGEGKDVSGDEIHSLIPDTNGCIYLYYPEQGIRVIDTGKS